MLGESIVSLCCYVSERSRFLVVARTAADSPTAQTFYRSDFCKVSTDDSQKKVPQARITRCLVLNAIRIN